MDRSAAACPIGLGVKKKKMLTNASPIGTGFVSTVVPGDLMREVTPGCGGVEGGVGQHGGVHTIINAAICIMLQITLT